MSMPKAAPMPVPAGPPTRGRAHDRPGRRPARCIGGYGVVRARVLVTRVQDSTPTTQTYLDALGRVIEQRRPVGDGRLSIVGSTFDAAGREIASAPVHFAGAALVNTRSYDRLGRVLSRRERPGSLLAER